jgi:hypothetical protein
MSHPFHKGKTQMRTLNIGFKVIFVKKVPQIGAGSVKLLFTEMFPW